MTTVSGSRRRTSSRAVRAAGVDARATNYVRVPHGFASFPGAVPVGAQHRAELVLASSLTNVAGPGSTGVRWRGCR